MRGRAKAQDRSGMSLRLSGLLVTRRRLPRFQTPGDEEWAGRRRRDQDVGLAARTSLGCVIAAQSIGVPGAVETVDNCSIVAKSLRGTFFRGNRTRTDRNDDGQCNRGLGEHGGLSRLKSSHRLGVRRHYGIASRQYVK